MRLVLFAVICNIVATAGFVVSPDLINFVVAIVTTVGTVIAVTNYIDKKIQHHISLLRNELLREVDAIREALGMPPRPKPQPEVA